MDKLHFTEISEYRTELPNGVDLKAEFNNEEEKYHFFYQNPKNGEWVELVEEGDGEKIPLTESSSYNVKKVMRRIAYGVNLANRWEDV